MNDQRCYFSVEEMSNVSKGKKALNKGVVYYVASLTCWESVSMDFIVGMPQTRKGKDHIMVVFNRFKKMAHFVAHNKTNDVKRLNCSLGKVYYAYL